MTRTFTRKFDATRAARKAGLENFTVFQGDDGRWAFVQETNDEAISRQMAEAGVPEVETPAAPVEGGACPFCAGDPSNQTPAGAEGSFLGDHCNECHECGKIYNVHTKEEVDEAAYSKKRTVLNPQPKIDAKTNAATENGHEITYERATRTWFLMKGDRTIRFWTSRQFSTVTVDEVVRLCK